MPSKVDSPMTTERIPVNPDVLRWARVSAGMSVREAADALGTSSGIVDRLEEGVIDPTIAQLRNAAHVYRRSLSVLLLPDVPAEEAKPVSDFRRRGKSEDPEKWSRWLTSEYRRAESQREVFVEIAGNWTGPFTGERAAPPVRRAGHPTRASSCAATT